MQPIAYRIIREEHRTLGAVINALELVLKDLRRIGAEPDFRLIRSMVYYMDAYPEKLHHPKEESQLFARLRQRTSEADAVLAELGREHAAGAEMIRDLEQALVVYEQGVTSGRERFEKEVARYATFYFSHMKKEEEKVLPLALRVLTEEDWRAIDAAFQANGDPLRNIGEARDFAELFTEIVNLAPAPIGLGPPLKH